MKVTLENTDKIVQLNGVPARIWEGETASGVKVHAYITRIAVAHDDDTAQFEQELQETRAPSPDVQALPLRMIL